MVSSGRPSPPQRRGDLVAEHGADRAVDVADRQRELDRLGVLDRRAAGGDQRGLVERAFQPVVLHRHAAAGDVGRHGRLVEDRREVEPLGLPVLDGRLEVQPVDAADHLVHRAEAERRHVLAHLLGDEAEEVRDELGLAGEALAQLGVLRGDADRAGVEVADAHHDAAQHHQRRRREAELLGAEQGGDDHVAPGLHLPVDLDDDPVAQLVEDEHLLGLGQAELPRRRRRA